MTDALKNHQAADAFPMMDGKRYAELLSDMRRQGQIEAITVCDGMILDGRNRYKACLELGIEPKLREFEGDPWERAWSLNGERRDLVDEQRYLIWKFCHENSEGFQAEKKRIADEANRKRSEAQAGIPKVSAKERKNDIQQSVGQRSGGHTSPSAKAAVAMSKTNAGAVARGDKLAKTRPDLAEAVRKGDMKPAEAHREMKRAEIIAKLEDVEAREQKELSGKYDVIVIDPPWPMKKIDREERPNQVAFEYPTMTIDEIIAMEMPAADDCHLWMWTTQRFLPDALSILEKWGFKYVCAFVWHKPGGFQPIGLPQYNCEFAIYARKGAPKFIDTKAFPTCFNAPRGAHSEKPEEFYNIVRRVTAGRRIDIFNRRAIDGFDVWGKEAGI